MTFADIQWAADNYLAALANNEAPSRFWMSAATLDRLGIESAAPPHWPGLPFMLFSVPVEIDDSLPFLAVDGLVGGERTQLHRQGDGE